MAEAFTRLTLFVPGRPSTLDEWGVSELLEDAGIGVEHIDNDGTFGEAFSFGTVAPDEVAEIASAASGLVLYSPVDLIEGRRAIVEVAKRLRDAGALAIRSENSKVGWAIDRWIELFSSDDPWDWHIGAVALLEDEATIQTLGMHAFSRPDVVAPVRDDLDDVRRFATVLDVYQMADDPLLLAGQTFAPDRDTPVRALERWPDVMYPPGHPCHNPYGVWRLSAPNANGRDTSDKAIVFMPALRLVLTKLEANAGRPLTEAEVVSARDAGVCMAMDHRDAQKLERSRGYADLDPELVWEQWQLLSESRR